MFLRAVDAVDLGLIRQLSPDRPLVADRLLPAASAAAEGSRLWLATATGLALFGGTRGRRAAAQGAAAVGITSVLVNGGLKQVVGRPRPGRGIRRAVVTKRGRQPRTSSMPSSHAAAGAAFATAVGCTFPAAAAPLTMAAGVVGWSRINAGRHHPSDVVVGLAVGAAVGAGVHLVARRVVEPVE